MPSRRNRAPQRSRPEAAQDAGNFTLDRNHPLGCGATTSVGSSARVYVNWRKLRIPSHFATLGRVVLVYHARMTEDQVRVQGATGVDLTLRIAGPGNRSYAFIIDWHLRLLLALIWLLVAEAVFGLSLSFKTHDALLSDLPALCIYFLYHPLLEMMLRGRTPGKRMAGVRVVTRLGGTPTVGALLIRNLFRTVDSLPAFYVVGLICCFVSANRVRIGDMAAGTLLVVEDGGAEKSLARVSAHAFDSRLSLDGLELVDQLLERWDALETTKRTAIAVDLLARLEPPGAATGSDPSPAGGAADEAHLRTRLRELLRSASPAA
jgi:uncharacterized RDD family membrane protein YckC